MASLENMKNFGGVKAENGINGDTELRKIDNIVSHVTPYEAYLKDNLGSLGEEIIKEIGVGTPNAKDGAPQYFIKSFFDWVTPTEHTGWFSSAYTKTSTGDTAKEVVSEGFEGIQDTKDQYFGDQGIFAKEKQTATFNNVMNAFNLNNEFNNVKSGTDFSTTGNVFLENFKRGQNITQSKQNFNQIAQSEFDLKMNLRQQLNQLLTGYTSATGEGYAGADDLYEKLDNS